MKTALKEIVGSFKNLLFPQNITCSVCKQEVADDKAVCEACLKKLPIIKNACQKCGCTVQSGNYCIRCKNTGFDFLQCLSVCDYDDFVKNIIFRFKNGDRYLSEIISPLMAKKLKDSNLNFDLITCVPVTKRVLKQRGYNQSKILMEEIAKILNIETDNGNLIKVKETEFQKNLSAKLRQKNMENAFSLVDKSLVNNKTILVIDDVITTGSTLNSCANALYKGKAKAVYCCTFSAVETVISMEKPI